MKLFPSNVCHTVENLFWPCDPFHPPATAPLKECPVTEKEAFAPFLPTFRVLASQFVGEFEVKDRKSAPDCGVLDNLWATISFGGFFLG